MTVHTALRSALFIACVVGCGSVDEVDSDARSSDAPVCVGNTIDACGLSCETCEATTDREAPTCDGTMCGVECIGGAPTCDDGSCSRLAWDFESGTTGGITPRTPVDLTLRVAQHLGSQALAIDVDSLADVTISFPLCNSGAIDFSDRQLRFNVFFDGGNTNGEQYFVQVSAPSPMTEAFVGTASVQAGTTVVVDADFGDSTFSNSLSEFTLRVGSFGAAFSGTIYFDDFRIE